MVVKQVLDLDKVFLYLNEAPTEFNIDDVLKLLLSYVVVSALPMDPIWSMDTCSHGPA
jgi:hypothetical protein